MKIISTVGMLKIANGFRAYFTFLQSRLVIIAHCQAYLQTSIDVPLGEAVF
ncbi:MAG: hypothetical protein LBH44_04485 [Treponema sp.]|nr:hypothetical protein [Treponema sp.]